MRDGKKLKKKIPMIVFMFLLIIGLASLMIATNQSSVELNTDSEAPPDSPGIIGNVTSPAYYETWNANQTYEIIWIANPEVQFVDICLFITPSIASVNPTFFVGVIVNETLDNGSYCWAISPQLGGNGGYQVEIYKHENSSIVLGTSAMFTINPVRTRPSQDEFQIRILVIILLAVSAIITIISRKKKVRKPSIFVNDHSINIYNYSPKSGKYKFGELSTMLEKDISDEKVIAILGAVSINDAVLSNCFPVKIRDHMIEIGKYFTREEDHSFKPNRHSPRSLILSFKRLFKKDFSKNLSISSIAEERYFYRYPDSNKIICDKSELLNRWESRNKDRKEPKDIHEVINDEIDEKSQNNNLTVFNPLNERISLSNILALSVLSFGTLIILAFYNTYWNVNYFYVFIGVLFVAIIFFIITNRKKEREFKNEILFLDEIETMDLSSTLISIFIFIFILSISLPFFVQLAFELWLVQGNEITALIMGIVQISLLSVILLSFAFIGLHSILSSTFKEWKMKTSRQDEILACISHSIANLETCEEQNYFFNLYKIVESHKIVEYNAISKIVSFILAFPVILQLMGL